MSKTTITVDIYECDNIDELGNKCELNGERGTIKECAVCGIDLCSRHYQFLSVSRHGGNILSYYFCNEHSTEFIDHLVGKYGDTRPKANPNMGK